MMGKWYLVLCTGLICNMSLKAQYIPALLRHGSVQNTLYNPAIPMKKTINLGLATINTGLSTDGFALNELTGINQDGARYIDINKIQSTKDGKYNLYFENDIRTIDVGINLRSFALIAGHGFRMSANAGYTTDLIKLLANGNGSYIGKTLDIGPALNAMAYNELYIGAQTKLGSLTLGLKAKLLYGTASLYSEVSRMLLTTKEEFYQLQFENHYLIRSSSLLKYKSLDDITIDYAGFTLDNLFYNNRGFAMDMGVHYQLNDRFSLNASALDIGRIDWDYAPRKYETNGIFNFEGVDIIDYIQDSTLNVRDTLLQLLDVQSSLEPYSTTINSRYTLGADYILDSWSFHVLYQMHRRFGYNWHQMTLGTVKKISFLDIGLLYTINKSDYRNLGLHIGLNLRPVHLYVSTTDVLHLLSFENARSAGIGFGLNVQF